MACLAPQFRCAPSPSAHAHHQPPVPSTSSSRCPGLRVGCAVTSVVVDASRVDGCCGETLGLTYVASDPASALKRNFKSNFASESLLNEEAVVAAAVAEAVALARAAVEAAQEVVRMVQMDNNQQPVTRQKKAVDNYLTNAILRTELEPTSSLNEYANDGFLEELEAYGIMGDKGEHDDDAQYVENIAVKSARQSERRARRTRAATKAANSVHASQKMTTSSSKKKRSKSSSNSMNPLGSLWKMTGRRFLTAKEEVEFLNGIQQDHLKLEAIQAELT